MGVIYQQGYGTAVGSPVSVLANLVMEDVKERALAAFPKPLCFGSVTLMMWWSALFTRIR